MLRDLPFYDYVPNDTWKELDKQYNKIEKIGTIMHNQNKDKDDKSYLINKDLKQILNSKTDSGFKCQNITN